MRKLVPVFVLLFVAAACGKPEPKETPAAPPGSVKGEKETPSKPEAEAEDPAKMKGENAPAAKEAQPEADGVKAAADEAPKAEQKAEGPKENPGEAPAKEADSAPKDQAEAKADTEQKAAEPEKNEAEVEAKADLALVPPVPVKGDLAKADTDGQEETDPAPETADEGKVEQPVVDNKEAPPTDQAADGAKPVAILAAAGTPAGAALADDYTPPPFQNVTEGKKELRAREAMVKMLSTSYRHAITSERVLKAMGNVPRHEYMLPENRDEGYRQMWFRIGHGQTITDPGMVAWMTQLLAIKPTDKVLEIGTGSGYQGTILAQLTPHTYTIEIVEPLAKRTYKLLEKLGYDKVIKRKLGDGYYGWEEEGPFDKIIVTCAADHIPIMLLQQLKPGGLMVIPVGPRYQPGKLHFVSKDEKGKIHKKVLGKVNFVPMTRLKDWGKTDDKDAERKALEKESKSFKFDEQ